MTKKNKNLSANQLNLFEWLKNSPSRNPLGSLDIDSEIRAAISEDLKTACDGAGRGISRYEVAARISELTGHEITASMLYNWTAESHSENKFPLNLLPAFVIATGRQRRTFEVLSRHSGLFALPGPEALRAEIQQFEERIKDLRDQRDKRKILLKEITPQIGAVGRKCVDNSPACQRRVEQAQRDKSRRDG